MHVTPKQLYDCRELNQLPDAVWTAMGGGDLMTFLIAQRIRVNQCWEALKHNFDHSHVHCWLLQYRLKGDFLTVNPFNRYNMLTRQYETVSPRKISKLNGRWTGEIVKVRVNSGTLVHCEIIR